MALPPAAARCWRPRRACPAKRPRVVDARLERPASTRAGRRSRARPRHRRRAPAARRRRSASASTAADGCVPLMSARPSLGPSTTGARPAARSASAPGTRPAVDDRLAFADEHEREVRERREVAAGADRAAARHDRVHAGVEQRDQRIERARADAGVARTPARWRGAPSSRARRAPGSGSPTPAAWLRSRFICSASSASCVMRTSANDPKPVLMP